MNAFDWLAWRRRADLYADFESETIRDFFDRNNLYGLEKFWAFYHYKGLPEGSGLTMDPRVSHGRAWALAFCAHRQACFQPELSLHDDCF